MKLFKRIESNTKGFAHVEMILIAAVVAVVAVAGLAVYKHDHKKATVSNASSKNSSSKFVSNTPIHPSGIKLPQASANNWSYVANYGGSGGDNVYACKTYIAAYGGVYQINAMYTKPAGWFALAYIQPGNAIKVNDSYVNSVSTQTYWQNTVATLQDNYSIALASANARAIGPSFTTVRIGVSGLYGTGASWTGNPTSLVNC